MIEGRNFLITVDDETAKYGFYTTRFVEARDEEDAETKVVEMLRNDPKLVAATLNERSDSPMIYVEEIEELTSFRGYPVPGTGCTWYPEEGEIDLT